MRDVELTVFLGAAWIGRSVVAIYACTGASVLVFTREVLVISDLVAGHQCAARTAAGLPPFSTASQMVTAKAPPLPLVFLCISLQDPTVEVGVVSSPSNASFASTSSIVCGASIQQSLEFEYLVGGCLQDGNVSLGIGIGSIVVHSRNLVDNPAVFVSL